MHGWREGLEAAATGAALTGGGPQNGSRAAGAGAGGRSGWLPSGGSEIVSQA
jgi:hypothetical protein